jgi:hypothetical protein
LGQVVTSGAENNCIFSKMWLQALHWYS